MRLGTRDVVTVQRVSVPPARVTCTGLERGYVIRAAVAPSRDHGDDDGDDNDDDDDDDHDNDDDEHGDDHDGDGGDGDDDGEDGDDDDNDDNGDGEDDDDNGEEEYRSRRITSCRPSFFSFYPSFTFSRILLSLSSLSLHTLPYY